MTRKSIKKSFMASIFNHMISCQDMAEVAFRFSSPNPLSTTSNTPIPVRPTGPFTIYTFKFCSCSIGNNYE